MLEIKNIIKGDTFVEYDLGLYDQYIALEDAHHVVNEDRDGWVVLVKHVQEGYETEFFVADGFDHYGPTLYRD